MISCLFTLYKKSLLGVAVARFFHASQRHKGGNAWGWDAFALLLLLLWSWWCKCDLGTCNIWHLRSGQWEDPLAMELWSRILNKRHRRCRNACEDCERPGDNTLWPASTNNYCEKWPSLRELSQPVKHITRHVQELPRHMNAVAFSNKVLYDTIDVLKSVLSSSTLIHLSRQWKIAESITCR